MPESEREREWCSWISIFSSWSSSPTSFSHLCLLLPASQCNIPYSFCLFIPLFHCCTIHSSCHFTLHLSCLLYDNLFSLSRNTFFFPLQFLYRVSHPLVSHSFLPCPFSSFSSLCLLSSCCHRDSSGKGIHSSSSRDVHSWGILWMEFRIKLWWIRPVQLHEPRCGHRQLQTGSLGWVILPVPFIFPDALTATTFLSKRSQEISSDSETNKKG